MGSNFSAEASLGEDEIQTPPTDVNDQYAVKRTLDECVAEVINNREWGGGVGGRE